MSYNNDLQQANCVTSQNGFYISPLADALPKIPPINIDAQQEAVKQAVKKHSKGRTKPASILNKEILFLFQAKFLTAREMRVLLAIFNNGVSHKGTAFMTDAKTLQHLLGLSVNKVYEVLKKLRDKEVIDKFGYGSTARHQIRFDNITRLFKNFFKEDDLQMKILGTTLDLPDYNEKRLPDYNTWSANGTESSPKTGLNKGESSPKTVQKSEAKSVEITAESVPLNLPSDMNLNKSESEKQSVSDFTYVKELESRWVDPNYGEKIPREQRALSSRDRELYVNAEKKLVREAVKKSGKSETQYLILASLEVLETRQYDLRGKKVRNLTGFIRSQLTALRKDSEIREKALTYWHASLSAKERDQLSKQSLPEEGPSQSNGAAKVKSTPHLNPKPSSQKVGSTETQSLSEEPDDTQDWTLPTESWSKKNKDLLHLENCRRASARPKHNEATEISCTAEEEAELQRKKQAQIERFQAIERARDNDADHLH